MSSIFEIKPEEIKSLRDVEFVDMMNHLLCAEADRVGVPPNNVSTSLRVNDPDGGVDARTVIPEGLEYRWIPLSLSV